LLQDSILLPLSFTDSAADPMNCLFSDYVNYGGMASSPESFGMAYDSITNQIYLTDASEHRIFQVSYRDNDIFFVLLLTQSMIHRLVM
jgi:hypothetical protein